MNKKSWLLSGIAAFQEVFEKYSSSPEATPARREYDLLKAGKDDGVFYGISYREVPVKRMSLFATCLFLIALGTYTGAVSGCGGGGGGGAPTAAPTVSSVDPADGAVGVLKNATVSVTFSSDMDETTITTNTFPVTRPGVSATEGTNDDGAIAYSAKTATFTPSPQLALLTPYEVTLTTGIKDAAGVAMESDYSWGFTTADGAWGTGAAIETDNTENASNPQIASDLDGNAIAVWSQSDGVVTNIWVNRYTSGAGWSTAGKIETDDAGNAANPQIAFDPSGNAIAVWEQSDGVRKNIWANFYTAGAGWGAAAKIETDDAGDAKYPQIAFDPNGNAIAVWRQTSSAGTDNAWANFYTAGTGWGTAEMIETDDLGDVWYPQIAFDTSGNAIAVWEQEDALFVRNIWANRYLSGTGWGTAGKLETDDAGNAANPQVAFDLSGNAIAVWNQSDGTRFNIWANSYTAGTGWGTAAMIETDDAGNAFDPQIAFDPSGNAIAVWDQTDGTRFNIWANSCTTGTGWGTAAMIETDDAGGAFSPEIAFDLSGNAIAVWEHSDGTRDNILANRYVSGTGWGTAATIETDDNDANAPQIAVDTYGNAFAVWGQSDGTLYNIFANRFE